MYFVSYYNLICLSTPHYSPSPPGSVPTDSLLMFGMSALIMEKEVFLEFGPLLHSEFLRLEFRGPRSEAIKPKP